VTAELVVEILRHIVSKSSFYVVFTHLQSRCLGCFHVKCRMIFRLNRLDSQYGLTEERPEIVDINSKIIIHIVL